MAIGNGLLKDAVTKLATLRSIPQQYWDLKDAIDEGFVSQMPFDFWTIDEDPLIASLLSEPRFIEMRAEVERLESLAKEPQEQNENRDHELEKAIAELGDPYREIVLLRFYAGQSCLQIAEQLNMPIGTVTKQLSRAYAKLRQSLSDRKEAQK